MVMDEYIAKGDHSIKHLNEYTVYINLDHGNMRADKTILIWHGKTYEASTSEIIKVLLDHSIFREVD